MHSPDIGIGQKFLLGSSEKKASLLRSVDAHAAVRLIIGRFTPSDPSFFPSPAHESQVMAYMYQSWNLRACVWDSVERVEEVPGPAQTTDTSKILLPVPAHRDTSNSAST